MSRYTDGRLGLNFPRRLPWITKEQFVDDETRWVKPGFRRHHHPYEPPLEIGDVVACGQIIRPADIGQRFRVVGLNFSQFSNGWIALLAYGESPPSNPSYEEFCERKTSGLCRVQQRLAELEGGAK